MNIPVFVESVQRYQALGYRFDTELAAIYYAIRTDQRGQGVACGNSWISSRKKCSRDKAKSTSKANLAKTKEKAKAAHALKRQAKRGMTRPEIEAEQAAKKGKGKPQKRVTLPDDGSWESKAQKAEAERRLEKSFDIWNTPRDEWVAARKLEYSPADQERWEQKTEEYIPSHMGKTVKDIVGGKLKRDEEGRHRVAVEDALFLGAKVSNRVLKDYPGLAEEYGFPRKDSRVPTLIPRRRAA